MEESFHNIYVKSSQWTLQISYNVICLLYLNEAEKKNLDLGPMNDFKIWGEKFTEKAAAELRKKLDSLQRQALVHFQYQRDISCAS